MKRKIWITLWMVCLVSMQTIAQSQSTKSKLPADSTKLSFALLHGKPSGNFRYFFMATDNAPGLTDSYAQAVGGSLRYETAPFHRLQFATGGSYVYHLSSSDLAAPDSLTGMPNRYEMGLFDIAHPGQYRDMYRLEELLLRWRTRRWMVTAGKFLMETPFINLQDGRMRPTAVEGIWSSYQANKKFRLEGGWLYRISPRSTMHWYKVGESIGRNGLGVTTTGQPSGYRDALQSKGVLMLGTNWQPHPNLSIKAWNLMAENIFNSALLQVEYGRNVLSRHRLSVAGQMIRQDAIAHGGNRDPSKAYLPTGSHAWTFGGRVLWRAEVWEASLNYNRVTAAGRYLMPREWGRDPFFTFLTRERTDGLGNVHAIAAKAERSFYNIHTRMSLGLAYVHLPAANDFRLNKYGLTSYAHANADIRHYFGKPLDGLEAQLLVVGKINAGDLQGNPHYEFNKVNLVNYNLVLNYNF